MTAPLTATGRKVWGRARAKNLQTNVAWCGLDDILAIEQEARQPAPPEGLREDVLAQALDEFYGKEPGTMRYAASAVAALYVALARQEATEPEGPITDANGDELERGAPDYAGQ